MKKPLVNAKSSGLIARLQEQNVHNVLRFVAKALEIFLSYGLFFSIIGWKLDFKTYFPRVIDFGSATNLLAFISGRAHLILLSAAVFLLFYDARTAIKKELLNLTSYLFSPGSTPQEYKNIHGYQIISTTLLVIAIVLIGLTYFIDDIRIFSIGTAIFAVMTTTGLILARETLYSYFSNAKYAPTGPHKSFVLRRRTVTMEYLKRAHVRKDIVLFSGSIVVLFTRDNISVETSTIAMAFFIVMNEITVLRWRRARDAEFEKIEKDQILRDRKKLSEN